MSRRGRPRSTGGKSRGPRDVPELVVWLEQGGYTVTDGGRGRLRILRGERLVAVIGARPGDPRALLNAVSTLRKVTGMRLRRDH